MEEQRRKISRIDSRNKVGVTKGYFVREYYRGLIISCLFSDRKYGGENEAKQKAEKLAQDLSDHKVAAIRTNQNLYEWFEEAEKIKAEAKQV